MKTVHNYHLLEISVLNTLKDTTFYINAPYLTHINLIRENYSVFLLITPLLCLQMTFTATLDKVNAFLYHPESDG